MMDQETSKISMLSIGLMSGTSMDGIDAALLDTDGEGRIVELGHAKLDYSLETKHLLKAAERAVQKAHGNLQQAAINYSQELCAYLSKELLIQPASLEKEMAQLEVYLQKEVQVPLSLAGVIQLSTQLHAKAVHTLLQNLKIRADEIDVIGYHGQTLFHHPAAKITVQIGDGEHLAKLTGITVINEFRSRDIAAGGEGAPFAPIYHRALAMRDDKIPLAVVNCGGIANVSLITNQQLQSLVGFDTGPGNGLIDALVRQRTEGKESMDFNGQYGQQGKVHEETLQALFEQCISIDGHNYFLKIPPKSLDIRDMKLIPALDALSLEDACATLEAFTAETIVHSLELLELSQEETPRHWVLVGGGWYNPVIKRELIQRLRAKLGNNVTVKTADEDHWNSDAMEAQLFAHFAVRSLKNLPLSTPGTTRVPKPLSGGRAHLPATGGTRKVSSLLSHLKNSDDRPSPP